MAVRRPSENPFDNFDFSFDVDRAIPVIVVALIVLIVVVGLFSSYYTVAPEGEAVIKRFGAVKATRGPGLHFRLPFGIDRVYFVPTKRVLKEEFGFETVEPGQRSAFTRTGQHRLESLMLTGDLNVVDVQWVVQYRISDADRFLHSVRNQRETIRSISESVVRRIVGNRLGSDVLTTGRIEIATAVKVQMQQILDTYAMGVHVATIELQTVSPPEKVKAAFNAVNEARQERERLINEAEKEQNRELPRAVGNAQAVIAEAEGYAVEQLNIARGAASRFNAILTQYSADPRITRQRLYLEMIDEVLPTVGRAIVVEPGQTGPIPLLNLEAAAGPGRGGQ